MLQPKSRLFHAIVVMGLGVTGCSDGPGFKDAGEGDAEVQQSTAKDADPDQGLGWGSPITDGAVADASDANPDASGWWFGYI